MSEIHLRGVDENFEKNANVWTRESWIIILAIC